jgi:hypothetical protein
MVRFAACESACDGAQERLGEAQKRANGAE